MRVASTGLGKTELVAKMFDLKPDGGSIGLHATTELPEGCAGWHLETYLEPQDMAPVLLGFLRPAILWTMIKSFLFPKSNPAEPETL